MKANSQVAMLLEELEWHGTINTVEAIEMGVLSPPSAIMALRNRHGCKIAAQRVRVYWRGRLRRINEYRLIENAPIKNPTALDQSGFGSAGDNGGFSELA